MAKCNDCKTKTNILFDGRLTDNQCVIYAVKDDGIKPRPSGLCKECFKKQISSDIDTIENKLK